MVWIKTCVRAHTHTHTQPTYLVYILIIFHLSSNFRVSYRSFNIIVVAKDRTFQSQSCTWFTISLIYFRQNLSYMSPLSSRFFARWLQPCTGGFPVIINWLSAGKTRLATQNPSNHHVHTTTRHNNNTHILNAFWRSKFVIYSGRLPPIIVQQKTRGK